MALYFMVRLRKGQSIGGVFSEKSNVLFYIAAKFKLVEVINHYGINEGTVSYHRFGDMLYSIGLRGNNEERSNAILALKCMLLNSTIADNSRNIIIENIKELQGGEFSQAELDILNTSSCTASKLLDLRRKINEFCNDPSEFIIKQSKPNKQINKD